jgi:hypothetical protein
MAEKPGSQGSGVQGDEGSLGSTSPVHRGSPGARGEGGGIYVNERGEVCYGNECVTIAIDKQRREIRVNVKQGGTCNIDPLVESLKEALGAGDSRTVYEVESVMRSVPKE